METNMFTYHKDSVKMNIKIQMFPKCKNLNWIVTIKTINWFYTQNYKNEKLYKIEIDNVVKIHWVGLRS